MIVSISFGAVSLELVFDDQMSRAMESLREKNKLLTPHHEHHHDQEFATWTFRSEAEWSFSALQRAVEHLPRGIFRAKGMVRLDLETDDYGILQVTGRRGRLKLVEPENGEAGWVTTELVFIGKPGTNPNKSIRAHFERALEQASSADAYVVNDLRAFNVVFA
ncbi:MAG: GTP-binding protein [Acidiferrobacterales bacterium]